MAVVILRIDQQFSLPCLRSCYGPGEGVRTHADSNCWITGLHPNHCTKPNPPTATVNLRYKEGWDTLSYTVCVQPLITQSQTTGGEWKWSAVSEGVRTHADINCCFTGQWNIRQGRCLCSPFKHCWPPIQWRINLVAQVAYATGPAFSRVPH